MRVLFIEDDHVLGAAIRDHVLAAGHAVDWMQRLDDARLALASVPYELVLLDLNLPDGRGLDLLKQLRAAGNAVPVIITTAQDQVAIRIEGLNSGADDYLVKPFDLAEMGARIAAVARRYGGNPTPEITTAGVTIDLGRRIASIDGAHASLTAREWAVLERLLARRGGIVTKSEIADSLYAFGAEVASNAVEVYVSRLRKKLGRDFVQTIRGLGYQVKA
ncbi:transcriptional regulator [Devosia limi DSM 17137]|uniref:Transcriptional regulator n=1 Tax=Devosia limi DSM 17137 TaxID=1121477 RepID=A0A0F5LXK2_9HYPH|nr:response regulator transcription factor [Devosia limi]KKB86392.1 transcriptional regulator [Devosia limi DSM 17137]SHE90773.1 Transcriptional regulatory protein, C terminal [Devosia limi DSM 17137]